MPTDNNQPNQQSKQGRAYFTPEGLEKLRQTALANQPWKHAAGPRSAKARAQSILNGKRRQKGDRSRRELEAELAGLDALISAMEACRRHTTQGMPQNDTST